MVNSRSKGANGEREWRDVLKNFGFSARRGQQFSGGADSPDVVCDDLPFHWEVKRVEALNIYTAIDQAQRDAARRLAGKIPAVAHRKNKRPWLVTLWAEDFLRMVKELDAYRRQAHNAYAEGDVSRDLQILQFTTAPCADDPKGD